MPYYIKKPVTIKAFQYDGSDLTLYPGVLFYMLSEYVLNPSVQRLMFLQNLKR